MSLGGSSQLHYAAVEGKFDVLQYLVEECKATILKEDVERAQTWDIGDYLLRFYIRPLMFKLTNVIRIFNIFFLIRFPESFGCASYKVREFNTC